MKVLIITNLFPNSRQPGLGIFNKQQFAELAKLCDIKVIAPIAWGMPRTLRGLGKPEKELPLGKVRRTELPGGSESKDTEGTEQREEGGIDVRHPRWLAIPKVGRCFHCRFYYWGIRKLFRQVCQQWKPDVVLATWAYPDACAATLLAQEMGLPCVVKVHGSDINAGLEVTWKRRLIRDGLDRADRTAGG